MWSYSFLISKYLNYIPQTVAGLQKYVLSSFSLCGKWNSNEEIWKCFVCVCMCMHSWMNGSNAREWNLTFLYKRIYDTHKFMSNMSIKKHLNILVHLCVVCHKTLLISNIRWTIHQLYAIAFDKPETYYKVVPNIHSLRLFRLCVCLGT